MSIVKTYDVFCDANGPDCLTWTQGDSTGSASARKAAKKSGWARVNGRDLCPRCIERLGLK